MKMLYKGIAVAIVAVFLVAMIPLTQAAAPQKTTTPTLKVASGSALKALKSGDGVLYLGVPSGKLLKLTVTFRVQKDWASTDADWLYKDLSFMSLIGVGPNPDGTTLSYYNIENWALQGLADTDHTFEVMANTSGITPFMPCFTIDWQSTAEPQMVSVYVLWWAEYYE